MVFVIDLKPNRDLLDPCFETYRLETQSLATTETKLQKSVSYAEISPGQFGLCHVQLQLKRNALITDDSNPSLVFYTSQGELHRLKEPRGSASDDTGSHSDSTVYKFPKSATTGSVHFVSASHAVVLEPQGTLLMLFTGPRDTAEKFEEVFSFESGLKNAVVLNTMEFSPANKKFAIQILICSVIDDEEEKRGSSCLDWFVLEGSSTEATGENDWKVARRNILYGEAVPKYTKFLHNASVPGSLHLLICADCRYRADGTADDLNEPLEESAKAAPLYTYIQDETEATVTFSLESNTSKNDVKVTIRPHKIEVKIKNVTVIDSRLHDNVDPGASVWCIVDSRLEIALSKRNEARWPRLLIDDDRGEEIFDPAYATEVHNRLQHLTTTEQDTACASNLTDSERGENCDEPPDEFHIEVFRATDKGTERVGRSDMTGREHIMDMWSADGPQLVLRHDVDGLVWKFSIAEDGLVRAEHVHTMSAFGYVVASKRDRVLLTGCLEAGHAALVDAKNNVFIYEHQNEGGPKKTVLKEYVVPLRSGAAHVIGGGISAEKLHLLTSDTLFAIALPKRSKQEER